MLLIIHAHHSEAAHLTVLVLCPQRLTWTTCRLLARWRLSEHDSV